MMMSSYTKRRAAELVKTIAEGEIKVEVVRQVLAEKYMFEPYSAFKRMSNHTSGITSLEMREFLDENGLMITRAESHTLMRMFDTDGDGKMSFSEFLNMILPRNDSILRKTVTMRESFSLMRGEKLPYEVEYSMMRVFEEELKAYHKNEKLRRELALYDDFSLHEMFKMMDMENMGYADMESVAEFMDMMDKPMDMNELKAFMRRVDSDADGRITFSEMMDAFLSHDKEHHHEKKEEKSMMMSDMKKSMHKEEMMSMTTPKKKVDDYMYMSYVRKAETSPKAKMSSSMMMSKTMASPSKKLGFEEDNTYKTPTKSSHKMESNDMNESMTMSQKKSPLKPRDELEMVHMLKEVIEANREMETMKNELAMRRDFNLFNAFNIFDAERTGYLTSSKLNHGLKRFGVYMTNDELHLVMKRFDTKQMGTITFGDFSEVFTPKSADFAKIMSMREPTYLGPYDDEMDAFSMETVHMFSKMMKHIHMMEIKVESMRQMLANRPEFTIYSAFKALDKEDRGYITNEEFREMLEDYGMFVTSKDLQGLMDRYEVNYKGSGKVTYTDFLREMSPQSVMQY